MRGSSLGGWQRFAGMFQSPVAAEQTSSNAAASNPGLRGHPRLRTWVRLSLRDLGLRVVLRGAPRLVLRKPDGPARVTGADCDPTVFVFGVYLFQFTFSLLW